MKIKSSKKEKYKKVGIGVGLIIVAAVVILLLLRSCGAPADGFAGIELQGQHYDERVAAGEALLNILPTVLDT